MPPLPKMKCYSARASTKQRKAASFLRPPSSSFAPQRCQTARSENQPMVGTSRRWFANRQMNYNSYPGPVGATNRRTSQTGPGEFWIKFLPYFMLYSALKYPPDYLRSALPTASPIHITGAYNRVTDNFHFAPMLPELQTSLSSWQQKGVESKWDLKKPCS